jgi:hypothetical protein
MVHHEKATRYMCVTSHKRLNALPLHLESDSLNSYSSCTGNARTNSDKIYEVFNTSLVVFRRE